MCSAVPPLPFLEIVQRDQWSSPERKPERRRNETRNKIREARDIEDIVAWTYQQQQAHRSASGLGRERGWLRAGALDYSRPMVQGGGAGAFDLHPDAELVHDAIGRLGLAHLAEHGRGGTRPDCKLRARTRYEPELDGRGYPTVVREWDRHRNPVAPWCPIVYRDPVEVIVAARTAYLAWWHDLVALRRVVAPRLVRWHATGPAAPRRPWLAPA
ncbi:hypothetical protein STVA_41570 [Allostella vacuolata]|nr:hypothetical protein STVA_41570 [Stella vacuolata]